MLVFLFIIQLFNVIIPLWRTEKFKMTILNTSQIYRLYSIIGVGYVQCSVWHCANFQYA